MGSISGYAWTADEFGEPGQVLQWRERSFDPDADGQTDSLLIEVRAAGVGLPDLLMTRGSYPLVATPPVTPGQEVSGTVVTAPANSRFKQGDRVLGTTPFYAGSGGFATHAYLSESAAIPVPDEMSDVDAAGFYIGFRTAHTTLAVRCEVKAGESVLVLGGAGGTGATSISLAKALGAKVVAVASSKERRQFCTNVGADAVIERSAEAVKAAVDTHTEGRGFDVVVDPVGGEIAQAAFRCVARYGRFAPVGFASGSWVQPEVPSMVFRNFSLVGVLAAGFTPEEDEAHISELLTLAADGRIATPVGQVAGISEVPAMIASLGGGAPPGKIVVQAGA